MALTYDQDTRLRALSPVLEEHSEWQGRVVRHLFYPEAVSQPQDKSTCEIPKSFADWVQTATADDVVPMEMLVRLSNLHDDLGKTALKLVAGVAQGQKPDIRKFDEFVSLYDEFIAHVRRLERDLSLKDSGFDLLTGLRSRQTVTRDLEREMERRSRRGKPFCLGLARIDHNDEIRGHLSGPDYEAIVRSVADIIKKCMRSFDDAYHLGHGEFLMCLKQTDLTGGTAGLGRLRKLLDEHAPYFTLNGKELRVSVSSCVAEPQPGDHFEDMMINMRKDLDRFGGGQGTALEYVEVSPLKRFILDADDDSKNTH